MASMVDMLLYLLHDNLPSSFPERPPLFRWTWVPGLYQSERVGDCGLVSEKFVEMVVFGCAVGETCAIKDKDVDSFQKKYVVDIYSEFVE